MILVFFKPLIWVVNLSEIARPAASSFALLMRRPDDSRSKEVANAPWELFKFLWAFNDRILVLII